MRRLLLTMIGLTAALGAAVLVWVVGTLPPATIHPAAPVHSPELVTGAYHIHSSRSDGSGTVDQIAAAASRAGLQFVIITDHGDATRPPDPPAYRYGVLCIDAVEISSAGAGHVVALGLTAASPYPLAGEMRDVVEDIHRQGAVAVAAHPDSPRQALRFRAPGVRVDGLEWLNVDSEWRAHTFGTLAAAATRAVMRAPESVAALFQWPTAPMARWDTALETGDMFSLAAVDAHARLGQDPDAGGPSRSFAITFPGYETMFRTVVQTVKLDAPLSGDAARDAARIIQAIEAGRSFSVVRAFIDHPFALTFSASAPGEHVEYGGRLADAGLQSAGGPVMVRATLPEDLDARLVLLLAGREVASGRRGTLEFLASDPGVYRVEARLPNRTVPWIVSNAIRVGGGAANGAPPRVTGRGANALPGAAGVPGRGGTITPIDPASWVVESNPTSTGTVALAGSEVRLRYRLGSGEAAGQYVALASGASGATPVERIEFMASSPRPMRVSVQIRLPGGVDGQRWQRSVYLDQGPQRVSVALADMQPVDRGRSMRPISARVQSILIVIDTLNTLPGASGEVVLRDVSYVAARPPAEPPGR